MRPVKAHRRGKGVVKAHARKDKHPGFKAVAASIASREGIPVERASAILAASSRNASPAARKRNPRLKKVKGG